MRTPSECYAKSEIKYPGEFVELHYGKGFKSRYVNDRGYLNYKQKRIFVGNPFTGYHVGLKESVDKSMEICLLILDWEQ